MSRREKLFFFDKKFSNASEIYYLEPALYGSITDTVEAINTLIQERHNLSEICMTVKIPRRTQKVDIHHANEGSGLAFFITDLGNIFGNNVGNQLGVMLRGKRPPKPKFAYDIVRIHSLIIHTHLIEYNIIGDTKAPLLRCFPFISQLKAGDIIITGQYMDYQKTSNLNSDRCSKNFSIVFILT